MAESTLSNFQYKVQSLVSGTRPTQENTVLPSLVIELSWYVKHSLSTKQAHTTSGRRKGSVRSRPRGAQQCHRQFICLLRLSEVVWIGHGCQSYLPFHLERKWSSGETGGGGEGVVAAFMLLFIIRYLQSHPPLHLTTMFLPVRLTGAEWHWLLQESRPLPRSSAPRLHLYLEQKSTGLGLTCFSPVSHSAHRGL